MGICINQNRMWSVFADDATWTVDEVSVAAYMAFCKNVTGLSVFFNSVKLIKSWKEVLQNTGFFFLLAVETSIVTLSLGNKRLHIFLQDHQVLLTSVCVHILALFLSLVENFYNTQMLCVGCRLQWWTSRLPSQGIWMPSMCWIFLGLNLVWGFNFQAVWRAPNEEMNVYLFFHHLSYQWCFSQVILCIGLNWLVKHVLKICTVSPQLPSQKGLVGEQGVPKTNIWHTRSRI